MYNKIKNMWGIFKDDNECGVYSKTIMNGMKKM